MRLLTGISAMLLGLLSGTSDASAYTLKRTDNGALVHWPTREVALRLDRDLAERMRDGESLSALEMGAEAWRGLPGVPDVLVQSGRPRAAGYDPSAREQSHGVYLVRDWDYPESQLAVTVTTYEEGSGRLLDADVLVNANQRFRLYEEPAARDDLDDDVVVDEPERSGGRRRYDLGSVLTHEVGHVLGLGESSANADATMWARIGRGELHQRTLETDDEDGVLALYSSRHLIPSGGCGGATVAGSPAGRLVPWATALILVLVVLARRTGPRRRAAASASIGATLVALALAAPAPNADALLTSASSAPPCSVQTIPVEGAATLRHSGFVGQATRLGVRRRGGLLVTEYRVRGAGGVASLSVPGGTDRGITQIAGEIAPPPDGAEIVVQRGGPAWALHGDGEATGGWLGSHVVRVGRAVSRMARTVVPVGAGARWL